MSTGTAEPEENATYNLESFEIFLISVPPLRRTLLYVLGTAAALLLVPILHSFGVGELDAFDLWPLFPAIVVATLIGGEAIYRIASPYPRRWGYFLSFVNQLLATGVLVVATLVPFVGFTEVVLLAAGFMALNGVQVLMITLSLRKWPHAILASIPQPVLFLAFVFGSDLPLDVTPGSATVLASAIGFVVVAGWISERMVAVNVDARGLDYSSALTLDTELDMGIGEPTRRPLQRLEITNDSGPITFAAPWFHPGLMSRIGGGRLSREITADINDGARGSYVKPPASHKSDPASPTAVQRIIRDQPELAGDRIETATRMIELERDGLLFRGRAFGDLAVVWFDSREFDDVEVAVYRDVVDPETQFAVDCHAHEPATARNLKAGTTDADRFREGLKATFDRLEAAPQHPYRAGFAEFESEIPGFAFVEQVDDERTLVVGFDGNNVTSSYRALVEELRDSYDRVLLLTTDTHVNPFDIDAHPPVSAAREAISEANADLSAAGVRLGSSRSSEITVLNDFYTKLIDSFNIGARFLIVSLGVSYLYLVGGMILVMN